MSVFSGTIESMGNDIFGNNLSGTAQEYLNVSASHKYYGTAFSLVDDFYQVIEPVGLALVITFFFLELLDSATKDNFTVEHFARSLIKLVITTIVIENSVSIFNTMMYIGYALANSIKLVDDYNITPDNIVNSLGGGTLFADIILILQLFIPWFISLIIRVGIIFACVGRALDMLIKCAFAPIGLSDMFTEGLRSSGVRYLKNFLASCLSAVIMVAALRLGGSIQQAVLSSNSGFFNSISSILTVIVFQAATLSLVMKSQSIARELIAG